MIEYSLKTRKPAVSVVMATYNYAQYVAGAIQSVRNQTLHDWELVIVDDGSTDATADVVRPFLKDQRIRYVYQRNQGQSAAENTGIRNTSGEWVAFIDADDQWVPEKLDIQIAAIASNPGIGVIYSDRILMDPAGREMLTVPAQMYRGAILNEIFRQNPVTFSSAMVRRSILTESGMFNPSYRHAGDYDLWLRVAVKKHEFDFVPAALVRYRTGHANLTSNGKKQLSAALSIMRQFLADHPRSIPRRWVRVCFSETFCHLGTAVQKEGHLASALYWYARALATDFRNIEAWGMLLRLFLPEGAVQAIKKLVVSQAHNELSQ